MKWKPFVLAILILAMVLGGVGSLATASAAPTPEWRGEGRSIVEVSVFRERLSPYGRWFTVASYGYVWSPFNVAAGWGPYVDGSWEYTDAGWTWISDDPWGWATCHYGRWFFDPAYGWVWVPGTEWAPAWVDWMYGDGFIGWAPLSPAFIGIGGFVPIPVIYFRFCRDRDFDHPHINRFIVPVGRNRDLFGRAHRVTNFDRVDGRVVNRSLSRDAIERAAGHSIKARPLAGADSPQALGAGRNREQNGAASASKGARADIQTPKEQRKLEHQQAAEQDRTARQQQRQQQQVEQQQDRQERIEQRAMQSQQADQMRQQMKQQRQAERQQMQMQQQQMDRQQMKQQRQAERQQTQMQQQRQMMQAPRAPVPPPRQMQAPRQPMQPMMSRPNPGGGNGRHR